VETGFHGAERHSGDAGDFIEGKFFKHVQHEHGALRWRELVHEREQCRRLLGAQHEVARIGDILVGGGIEQIAERLLAAGSSPVLHAKLVGDAEKPAAETRIIAQRADVPHCADKRGLHEIEAGGFMAHEFMDKGEKRQLIAPQQPVPGAMIARTGLRHGQGFRLGRHAG
jgi:hypothetical protein